MFTGKKVNSMAEKDTTNASAPVNTAEEKKKLKAEKKSLEQEQKQQKKDAKARAKDIATQQAKLDEESEGGGFSAFLVTVIIVFVWLAIIAILIKMDVGGFGSNVLKPVLKNVPIINVILPSGGVTDTLDGENYGGYTSLADAVEQIKKLEKDVEKAQIVNSSNTEEIALLKAEVERLRTFENNQVEFERVKLNFFEDVVYADNSPGAEVYMEYYEAMDPTTAEYLYKQVIQQIEDSQEVKNYAAAYAAMKPAKAAAIFEEMTNDLDLAARILGVMGDDDRGEILGAMNPIIAAKITKIMEPDG